MSGTRATPPKSQTPPLCTPSGPSPLLGRMFVDWGNSYPVPPPELSHVTTPPRRRRRRRIALFLTQLQRQPCDAAGAADCWRPPTFHSPPSPLTLLLLPVQPPPHSSPLAAHRATEPAAKPRTVQGSPTPSETDRHSLPTNQCKAPPVGRRTQTSTVILGCERTPVF